MTEETEEVETAPSPDAETGVPADDPDPDAASDRRTGSTADLDRAAESFLALEEDLDPGDVSGTARGRAVDVERVPAGSVPDSYPVEIRTAEALALTLEVEGERVDAYFEWDGDVPGDRLGRMLALKKIPADRFADLHGESIRLAVEDGHHVPVVPDEAPRGSPLGVYGVGAGLAMNLLTVALLVVGLGGVFSVPAVLAWLAANLLGVPAGTYLDAWHLRTHTDWNGGPLFWTALAAIPGVNVLSSAAYLGQRRRATEL